MKDAQIIGKAKFDITGLTRDYYEQKIIPWARNLWEDHKDEIWTIKGTGSGAGYGESKLSKVFRDQFMIESPRYLFPDEESMKHSCTYVGCKYDYLCGTMTDKERLLRIVICQLTEIEELCRISHCDPVFSVLQTECAKKLDIALLQYENLDPFCLPASILNITYYKDYTNIPSNLLADTPVLGNQLMQISNKSIASIRNESSSLSDMEEALKKEQEDISHNRPPELAKLQAQIEKIQDELWEKRQNLMEQLAQKQAQLNAQKKQLENELFLLETQIYSIRCASGEVYEIKQLRQGRSAPDNVPLTLFQKVKYMDQELGYLASVYDVDYKEAKVFERLIAENPLVFDTFCPTDKCIVIMRVSENSRYMSWDDQQGYAFYEKYHGNKTAIIMRNGENLYATWTDDDHINISGKAFFQPGKQTQEDIDDVVETDTKEGRASRIFLMNILQGIIDSGKIFRFPEKVNLLKPTRYITFSYADQYVTDNRFGTLADIQGRCSETIKKGDKVILLRDISDSKRWVYGWDGKGYWGNCDRGHGKSNRTKDCKLKKDTLYEINLVDNEGCFIRATKMIWSGNEYTGYEKEAGANFMVFPKEFLNLTYCNTIWIDYVLTTRNIGNMNNSSSSKDEDYAGLVKALKVAKEYLVEREKEEAALISQYADITDVKEWQVILSEWKIQAKVRYITDYQAKRFARFLNG